MRARRTVAAIALVSAVTACGLLTACDPAKAGGSGATPTPVSSGASGGTGGAGASGGNPTAVPSASATPFVMNGTAGSRLTISNGTSQVYMNGTVVDFGVQVRDLAWSPDRQKAAFVDGNGNLDVANPDGSGRITVATNPGGQTWSHPAWQVTPKDPQYGNIARSNLFFVAAAGGTTRLMQVPTSGGSPTVLPLGGEPGATAAPLPQTGNTWISGGGKQGESVYANPGTGEVYLRDDYIRQQGSSITNGSEPALIPGSGEPGMVFVRSVGGHDHVFVDHFTGSGSSISDLTPDATTDYTEPAVSPDGTVIAARSPQGIVIVPMNGAAKPQLISTVQGLPAYR